MSAAESHTGSNPDDQDPSPTWAITLHMFCDMSQQARGLLVSELLDFLDDKVPVPFSVEVSDA